MDDVNKEDSRRVLVAKMGDGRGIDLPNVKLGFKGQGVPWFPYLDVRLEVRIKG